MAVKYQCPKCGRRFAEWGAEKVGFKCPQDEWCPKDKASDDIELIRVGQTDEGLPKRPALKRGARKKAPVTAVALDEDEALVPDLEELEVRDEGHEEEEEEEEVVEVLAPGAEPLEVADESVDAIEVVDEDEDDEEDGELIDSDVVIAEEDSFEEEWRG